MKTIILTILLTMTLSVYSNEQSKSRELASQFATEKMNSENIQLMQGSAGNKSAKQSLANKNSFKNKIKMVPEESLLHHLFGGTKYFAKNLFLAVVYAALIIGIVYLVGVANPAMLTFILLIL
ncbi:MAG TPA: hypothetical protein VGF30_03105 [Bacteroidia bacterium]